MMLNERQQQAVTEINRDVLVLAGAGTGKTRVLTEKYLYLLETRGFKPERIVAITFTQKAAHEMRSRVREALESKVHLSHGRERDFWQEKLDAMGSAYIGTFHGFCQRILSEFALEAGIHPHMAILSSGEERIILKTAAERVCSKMASEGTGEEEQAFIEAFLKYGQNFFLKSISQVLPKVRESGEPIASWIQNSTHGERLDLDQAIGRLDAAVCALLQSEVRDRLTPRAKELLMELETKWNTLSPNPSQEIHDVSEGLEKLRSLLPKNLGVAIRPWIDEVHEEADKVSAAFCEREFLRWLPVLGRYLQYLNDEYTLAKERDGKMDFTDLQVKVRDLLRSHPKIRYECQQRYDYFMVDEFQDTNMLQLAIVNLLVGDEERTNRMGRLFVVGDAKQSIYRFRGAQVEVVQTLSLELENEKGVILPLQANYRCHPAIIEGINVIFEKLFEDESIPYHPLEAGRQAMTLEAECHWEILQTPESSREEEAERIAAFIRRTVDEKRLRVQADKGERTLNYGDVAILMRAMTDVDLYEAALRRWGVPYRISGGFGYYGLQEVQDQLNLIRLVHNSQDSTALLALLRSPYCGWDDEALYMLTYQNNDLMHGFYRLEDAPPGVSVSMWERLLRFRQLIAELQAGRGVMTVSEILRTAIDTMRYNQVLCAFPHAERALANIDKLLRKAEEFAATAGRYGLGDFINFIGELVAADEREGEADVEADDDVVQVLTVHAAKGLEFPLVIVADMERRLLQTETAPIFTHNQWGLGFKIPDGRGGFLDSPRRMLIRDLQRAEELSELKRLLYVALTRAKDFLVLSGMDMAKVWDGEVKTWGDWIRGVLPIGVEGRELFLGHQRVYVIDDPLPEIPDTIIPDLPLQFVAEATPAVEPITMSFSAKDPTRIIPVTSLLNFMRCPLEYQERSRTKEANVTETIMNHGALLGQLLHQLMALEQSSSCHHREYREAVTSVSQEIQQQYKRNGHEIEEYIRRKSHLLPPEEQEIFRESSLRLWSVYERSIYNNFEGKVFSEYEFIVPLGDYFLQGIIDRLMVGEDGEIVLVDFKTDRHANTQMDMLYQKYRPQLLTYALAVRDIFGKPPVRSEIFFLSADKAISESFSDQILSKWHQRLTEAANLWINQKNDPVHCDNCPENSVCSVSL